MTSDRDHDLVERMRAGSVRGVVLAEDPGAVATEVSQDADVAVVAVDDLRSAVAAARVRIAGVVVDRARRAEALAAVEPGKAVEPEDLDGIDPVSADRQAVRFALVILVLALPAGMAVHLADDMLLAPALPAAALLALGVVVLVHRRPAPPSTVAAVESVPMGPAEVEASPSVRAARAHLRRQEAAWKVSWWERDRPVPDLEGWVVRVPTGTPLTIVAVDGADDFDDGAFAAMTATAPAAVRVVVLRTRAS